MPLPRSGVTVTGSLVPIDGPSVTWSAAPHIATTSYVYVAPRFAVTSTHEKRCTGQSSVVRGCHPAFDPPWKPTHAGSAVVFVEPACVRRTEKPRQFGIRSG